MTTLQQQRAEAPSVVALVNFMGIGPIVYFAFGRKHA